MSFEEVLGIHELLTEDFLNTQDPIEPPGVRENGVLVESAVNRQHVGFGKTLKYPSPIDNAASLCYGICCNHGFHNGNKRAALVSLLCHLDKNNLTFKEDIGHDNLYRLMLTIASHKFAPKKAKSDTSDVEVKEIARWLNRKTRKLKKGEKVVTFRELEKILREHDIYLENPKGNFRDVIKYELKRKHIFAKKERIGRRLGHIPYPREGMVVGKKVLKSVREMCNLTEKDGYDSEMFYSAETNVCKFIFKYKKTLNRLAKT
ncbi:MAG: Fic family protein [Candidatus Parabeggiatoa sp.]|nr:Fic family protein [Candidatus Parabeggiatoa sp.]